MLTQSRESISSVRSSCVSSSTENGEKEKEEKAEPEPEVKEEEPEVKEEQTVKTKAKKDKKVAEGGSELWNELEVQRIKYMVRSKYVMIYVISHHMVLQSDPDKISWNKPEPVDLIWFGLIRRSHCFLHRTTFLATSTIFGSWPCLSPSLSISSCSSTRSVHVYVNMRRHALMLFHH